jgi:gliding motility-associated-like protein
VNPVPVAAVASDLLTICEGARVMLSASGGSSYSWFPSTGLSSAVIANPNASPIVTTIYNVSVANVEGCRDTATVTVNVLPKPLVNAGPDKIIFTGESVQLNGQVSAGDTYTWSPPEFIDDVLAVSPTVNPPLDQEYILTVTSSLGCGSVSDRVLVKVYKDIFVPTAFTPNNNAKNDRWNVLGLGAVPHFTISVFDRWGERIFFTRDEVKGWDGRYKGLDMPSGIYVYYIEAGKRKLKGTFMLIRD